MRLFPISYQKYEIIQKPRNPTFNLLLQLVAPALEHIYMRRHLKTAKDYLLPTYKKLHISAASLIQMVLPSSKHYFNNCSLSQEILSLIAMTRFHPASFEPLTFQQYPAAGNTTAKLCTTERKTFPCYKLVASLFYLTLFF